MSAGLVVLTETWMACLQTNNPGPWFLHCHIDFHLEVGFAVVFAVDTNRTSSLTMTDEWKNLCPTYNVLSSDDL